MDARTSDVGEQDEVRHRNRDWTPDERVDTVFTSTSTGERSPEEIIAEIEKTRAEMSETINTIQARLSPEHLKEQAQVMVRDATIGRVEQMADNATRRVRGFSSNVMETIRQNPVPAAMVGIGLGWLVMRGNDGPSTRSQYQEPYSHQWDRSQYRQGGWTQGQYQERPQDRVREMASDVQERAGQAVAGAREQVEELGEQARQQVQEMGHQARERVEELSSEVQYQAQQATDRFQQMVYENPLAMGAVALAVGAVIGLAVPETHQERRVMGPVRDDLVERAQDATRETIEKVKRVAEEVQHTAREEAEEEGLTNF